MPIKKIYSNTNDNKKMSLYLKKHEEPISSCKIYKNKELVMIGISMGNSYFSNDRLELMISGFSLNFKNVAILLVDDLAIHSYRAMGYTDEKAKKKIKKQSKIAISKINKAIKVVEKKYDKKNIKIIQWKDIELFPSYLQAVELITSIYNNNDTFSSEINQATFKVMEKHTTDALTDNSIIDEAKWYLLKELAFIYCASDFFESSLLTSYYTDFPLVRNILSGKYIIERHDHDFITYECVEH